MVTAAVIDGFKSKLERIAAEVGKRHESGESAREFYLKSLEWLTSINSSAHIRLRLQCHLDCAKYFYLLGDKDWTLKAAAAFERLAMRSGQKEWIRKAQCYRGIAHIDVGDFYQALVSLGHALRTARELRNPFDEAVVLVNIGYALTTAGLYTDALCVLERAFDLGMSERGLSTYASTAALNMAVVSFRHGRYERGIQFIRRSLELESDFPPEQYAYHRVTLEGNYVQLAVGIGDAGLADQRLLLCEQFARLANTRRTTLTATFARALCQIDHGDAREGINMLRSALQGVGTLTDESIDGHLFLIRGLEKTGQIEEALRCVEVLSSGLAQAYISSIQALVQQHDVFSTPQRPDQLDNLAAERARLQLIAAQHHAARAKWESIERLAMAAQLKDDLPGLHGHRVGRLSRLFAEHLRLKQDVIEQLEAAGRLHDIGKIAIPDQVLRSASRASPAERELLNAHARIGADLLAQSAIPELQCAEVVARHHHERWDGEGYPSRMKGKCIPVECRLVAIVDCFDAMTHGRPHVRPVSASVALGEIQVKKDKQFDPELADHFVAFMRQFIADHPDVSAYLEQSARGSPLSDAMRELGDLLTTVSRETEQRPKPARTPPIAARRPAPSTRPAEPL